MKIIATIQVNMDVTSLGTRSRLADDMVGKPVLRHTVERVARIRNVDEIHILCPADQIHACKNVVGDTRVIVEPFDLPPPAWAPLVQAARKWSLDGWRGGLGGSSYFDEFTDPHLLDAIAQKADADLVLSVPAAAVVFDPALADAMIDYYHDKTDDSKLTFAPTPPGLSGIILDRTMIHELATAHVPLGWVFSYKPDSPQKDLIFQPCCYEVEADLRFAYGRLLADTDRGVQRLHDLLTAFDDPDASSSCH